MKYAAFENVQIVLYTSRKKVVWLSAEILTSMIGPNLYGRIDCGCGFFKETCFK